MLYCIVEVEVNTRVEVIFFLLQSLKGGRVGGCDLLMGNYNTNVNKLQLRSDEYNAFFVKADAKGVEEIHSFIHSVIKEVNPKEMVITYGYKLRCSILL